MKIQWGNRQWETYKPVPNRKRQLSVLSFLGLAITADAIIPMTFGQITRGAYKIVKLNMGFMYK